jgi:uridine phosphorylase
VSDIPLLEFDDDRDAIINPSQVRTRNPNGVPERAVLCFYAEIIDALPDEAVRVGTLAAAHGRHPIWKVERHGVDIAVVHPGVGAPLAAAFLEELIALGADRIAACGGCGVVSPDIDAGAIVIPDSAVRDEGTSFHYAPPSRVLDADPEGVAIARAVLEERGVPFTIGRAWTTDGLYRETREKIRRRREEGCLVVEMEAAAFFAVARFRGVRFAQLLYGGDDVSGETWDEREWVLSPSRATTFELALEVASRL